MVKDTVNGWGLPSTSGVTDYRARPGASSPNVALLGHLQCFVHRRPKLGERTGTIMLKVSQPQLGFPFFCRAVRIM